MEQIDVLTMSVVAGTASHAAADMVTREQELCLAVSNLSEDDDKMCVFAALKCPAAVKDLRGDKNQSSGGIYYPHQPEGRNLEHMGDVHRKYRSREAASEIFPVFGATSAKSEPGSCLGCGNTNPEYAFKKESSFAFTDSKSHHIVELCFSTEVSVVSCQQHYIMRKPFFFLSLFRKGAHLNGTSGEGHLPPLPPSGAGRSARRVYGAAEIARKHLLSHAGTLLLAVYL